MKLLNDLITKVGGYDKVTHFAISGWLVSAMSVYGFKYMAIMFVAVLILSVIKELFLDEEFCLGDIVASCLGMFAALVMYIPYDAMI